MHYKTAARSLGVLLATSATLGVAADVLAQQAPARHVAVVIGVSQYPDLGAELALPGAYAEAAQLATALRTEGHYNDVRLLVDGQATRGAIEAVFKDELSRTVGYNDVLLVYFVGQGMGGDFDDPYLLTYDTKKDDIPGTALSVANFGADLRRWVHPRSLVIVTDASHKGSYQGLALLGPGASQWPDMGPSSLIVSASGVREAGVDGGFGRYFLDAITGGADADDNHQLVVGELQKYLLLEVPYATKNAQTPSFAGRFESGLVLAAGVLLKDTADPGASRKTVAQTPTPPPDVPTHTIDKAKFVFHNSQQAQVTCRDQAPVSCDPLCYVRQVKAGKCEVSAMEGSRRLTSTVFVTTRGVYTCEPVGGELKCSSPNWGG